MNGWQNAVHEDSYLEAVEATESLSSPAVGFSKAQSDSQANSYTIVKQNNTIIYLLIGLINKVKEIDNTVKRISHEKGKAIQEPAAEQLAEIQKSLQNLSLGKTVEKKEGPIFVFKDPKKIFDEEKAKLSK